MQRKRLWAGPADELRIGAVHWVQGKRTRSLLPFLDHPGTAVCLCVDNELNVLVVQQYRPVVGAKLIEVPGGVIRPGEAPREAARRETVEETGIRPTRLACLGTCFSSVGVTNERIYVFLSRRFSGTVRAERGLHAFWLPLAELVEAIVKEDALDAKTAVGVWLLQRRFERSSR